MSKETAPEESLYDKLWRLKLEITEKRRYNDELIVDIQVRNTLLSRGYVQEHNHLNPKDLTHYLAWHYLIGSTPHGISEDFEVDLPGNDSIVALLEQWTVE